MISANEARALKLRPVNQVTGALDAIDRAVRGSALLGRTGEIDAAPLIPQPYSTLWMNGEFDPVIETIKQTLYDLGYTVEVRKPSAGAAGFIKVCW